MSAAVFASTFLAPFSEYPVTRRFSDKKVSPILLCSSIAVFVGIAIFNLFTQTYQQSDFSPPTGDTSCQPASLSLGSTLFTVSSKQKPGGFPWMIGNIAQDEDPSTSTETGFRYSGDLMQCNATSASVLYRFYVQSFVYGLCVQCNIPTDSIPPRRYVRLCTDFDLAKSSLPTFTLETQNLVQAQLFGFGRFYPLMNLGANALPASAFPPNYSNGTSPFTSVSITPSIVLELSAWIDGISYVPSPNYQPYDGSDSAWKLAPQGTIRVGKSESVTDMSSAFRSTFVNDTSGIQLGVAGIGGVRPITNVTEIRSLRAPFGEIYDASLRAMAIQMDMATADVHGRKLGATYTCTKKHKQWKPVISLFAVMFANSAGLFAAALTAMIFVARSYDSHIINQRTRRESELSVMHRSHSDSGNENELNEDERKFKPHNPTQPLDKSQSRGSLDYNPVMINKRQSP